VSSVLARISIAAVIAFGAVSALGSAASAGDFGTRFQQVRYDPHGARICSPVLAVQKARGAGMRDARIANITPRRVVVEGRMRGMADRIAYANVPGCPLIHR
jgi:hypothetical protein